jgi:hypothetical protein
MRPNHPHSTSYFARTNHRHQGTPFGIKQPDRLLHTYVVGKTGTGKSSLLETMILQDIMQERGLALVDPHGDLVSRIAAGVPEQRRADLLYFNVPDHAQPYGYNPLRHVPAHMRPLAASGFLEVFKTAWPQFWGSRMEHILRNALLALLDIPDATLPDMLRLFSDRTYRRNLLPHIQNSQVRLFWQREYEGYNPRYRAEAIAPIQNKVGAFLADPLLRRILTAPEKPLRLRALMDQGKILLVNLSRGQLGSDTGALLGGLLVTSIGLAAFSRSNIAEEARCPFFLYLDEFQNFTTLTLATMASELRKYRVGLVLAHQYLDQLELDVRHAVIGNAGTLISFRLGAHDAAFIAKELAPKFEPLDLMNLANYDIYLKLMIDGMPSQPFSATTLPPQ